MKHKRIILTVLLLGIGITTQAQQAATATAGAAVGSGGNIAYIVGQVVYTTNMGTSGTVTQGVHQYYEIITLGIKEIKLDISISIFPNPTEDNLTMQIRDYNNEKLSYQLFDMQGKLLNNGLVSARQTIINTVFLPPAIYFINVVNQENKQLQSFKIIKN